MARAQMILALPSSRRPPSRRDAMRQVRARRLGFESLEDRCLLALIPGVNPSTGTQQTTYTLALATTAEFTQAAGGKAATKALLNQMNLELDRIFGRELAIRFQLHPQNDRLIFENAATDGYTNGSVASLVNENPGVINRTLNGSPTNDSGYDIGQVLGLGNDGGLSGTGIKARGATELTAAEISDNSIKALAHELGHQMGASHSFNGTVRECGSNRVPAAAVEPGSGSSVMAYQGLCDSDDLPRLPGDGTYFHAASFDEIVGFTSSALSNLGTKTPTGNSLPSVNAGIDRTIPAATPFTLSATASDPNTADRLTFTWDQIDAGTPSGIAVPIAVSQDRFGPLFRSLAPTADPSRTFPRIEDILGNTPASQNKNEHLPTQNRELDFRVTVRDNHLFNGREISGVKSDDVKLTVVNTGAPFRVTTWNGSNTPIPGGSQQSITWNVAGTTANGINTHQVDILLSVDGGMTYPALLATAIDNDGNETVTIPNLNVAKARIQVRAVRSQNVFFDINDADFQITQNLNVSGGIVITESNGRTSIAEGLAVQTGLPAVDTYTIALTQPPTSDVDIAITADSQTQVSLDGIFFAATQVITFAAGASGPRTVAVIPLNDTLNEGIHTGTIRHAVTRSNDADYNSQVLNGDIVTPVVASISDDESPPAIGVELDFVGPDATVPLNWTRVVNPFAANAADLVRENDEPTAANLTITIANPAGGAGWSFRTTDPTTVPRHSPDISLVDDVMYWDNSSVTATWSDLKPRQKYRVYVFAASESNIDSEEPIRQTVTITGNGNDNPPSFLQDGTGKTTGSGDNKQLHLFINGSVGSRDNPLETYGSVVTSTSDGRIVVKVEPPAGGPSVLSALTVQEFLEPLVVDPGPWQNTSNRFDVSGDGIVVPLDVLRIINELNEPKFRDPTGQLPDDRPTSAPFYDVNGDRFASTNDALQLINFLNKEPSPEGEWRLVSEGMPLRDGGLTSAPPSSCLNRPASTASIMGRTIRAGRLLQTEGIDWVFNEQTLTDWFLDEVRVDDYFPACDWISLRSCS